MDPGAQTIPNFLRRYNPDVIGGSLGDHFSEVYVAYGLYSMCLFSSLHTRSMIFYG